MVKSWLAITLASLFIVNFSGAEAQQSTPATLLGRINSKGELHAGYGVYPPYTQEDPATKKISGFSVDIIEQISRELGIQTKWHRLNWNTMAADLKRGTYDVIADPIFQTIPRAREFSFSAPYAYFADGIAVVRIGETRISSFSDLGKSGLRLTVGKGWASETLIRTRFPSANIVAVQTATDVLQVFNEVLSGRADVAIVDGATAQRFVKEHPAQVKALWLDTPPAFMPAGFAVRLDDRDAASFLTVALRNLEATGVLEALAIKYGVEAQLRLRR